VKAIINVSLYDYELFQPYSYIVFDHQIREVGLMEDFRASNMEVIDGQGMLLMPGLINFHTHIYSTLIRGLALEARPKIFTEILEDVWWRFDNALNLEDLYQSGCYYGRESIRAGVTALVDHHAGSQIRGSIDKIRAAIKNQCGMKALYCFETSDRFDLMTCIQENKEAVDHGDGLFGLHASLSLSDETLKKVASVLEGHSIHIHVAESIEDEEHALETYGMRVVNRLEKKGLLTEGSLLAHCVHINDDEARLIKSKNCRVVLNPTSNMNNAVGLFNFERLRNEKLDLLVGTDGLGVNVAKEWQQLYYLGKQSLNDPSGIGLDELRTYLLKSYTHFNSLAHTKLGRFKIGYCADFMMVDYQAPTPMTQENVFAHIFYGVFDQLCPKNVFIDGQVRLLNYQFLDTWEVAEEQVKALWERVRK